MWGAFLLKKENKNMNINQFLGIKESYQAPTALMKIVMNPEKLEDFANKYRAEYSDLSHDLFRDYFMSNQSDRKDRKQDFTPLAICDIVARLIGKQTDSSVLDIAGGVGGLAISSWNINQDGYYVVEELSTSAIPFLLFNLAVRKINAKVINCDSLTRQIKHVYIISHGIVKECQEALYEDTRYSAVISNPPYSLKWSADPALRIGDFELAPKSKADYQFVLEGLRRLKDDGTAVYVLPCGVLFRAAKEGTIRKQLIDGNYIDAVIGLPAKLFDVTGIPVVLLVLKRKRTSTDILFIDASHEFKKGKNKNELTPENCDKIIKAYHERKDMDKYAHVAPLFEIKDNDYNMNIPRYVDTFEPEPDIDIAQVTRDIIKDDMEIAQAQHQLYNSISQMVGTTPEARKEQADLIGLLNDEKR